MSKLRRFALFISLMVVFFALQEIQTRNDFFYFHSQRFSRVARQAYYMALTYLPKEGPAVSLDIKFHKQEHSLSCEIASLKMILDYRNLNISESELLDLLPFSDRGPRKGNVWGDPDKGFVGNIDGSMIRNTGYGVYEKPLMDLAKNWRDAEIVTGQSINRLIDELNKGNPIVVWGAIGSGKDNSWYTPEGKFVKAIKGAHVRVIKGYAGPSDNPTHIILLDPIYGELRWSIQKFKANWNTLEKRALVIY